MSVQALEEPWVVVVVITCDIFTNTLQARCLENNLRIMITLEI